MAKMKRRSVQIDDAGHQRVEMVARQMGFTQEAAASLLVRAATDDLVLQPGQE